MYGFNNARHLQYTTHWNVYSNVLISCFHITVQQKMWSTCICFKVLDRCLFPEFKFHKINDDIKFELNWMPRITLRSPQSRTFWWHDPPTSHRHTLCCCWSDDDSLHFLVNVSTWLKLEYSEIPLVFDESTLWLFPWKQI